jgi:hypothetical protein
VDRIIDGFKFGLGFGCAMFVFYFIAFLIVIIASLVIGGIGLWSIFG